MVLIALIALTVPVVLLLSFGMGKILSLKITSYPNQRTLKEKN